MAIVFQKRIFYNIGGTPPFTTPSATPNNAGDYLGFINLTSDGPSENIQMTSSAGGSYVSHIQFNDPTPATWSYNDCLACVGGAQTFTLTESNVGFVAQEYSFEYSGVVIASGFTVTRNNSPGTGTGAILGASVVVPVGSVLVALCIEPLTSETITENAGGTSRDSSNFNPSFRLVDYAGTGGSVQPAFTTSANGTQPNYLVWQVLLSPASLNAATIAWIT